MDEKLNGKVSAHSHRPLLVREIICKLLMRQCILPDAFESGSDAEEKQASRQGGFILRRDRLASWHPTMLLCAWSRGLQMQSLCEVEAALEDTTRPNAEPCIVC